MSDERIEAAGHAIYFAWNNTKFLCEAAPPEEGECRTFAEHALAAADSVERKDAGSAQNLAAALRRLLNEGTMLNDVRVEPWWEEGRAALAAFDAKSLRAGVPDQENT